MTNLIETFREQSDQFTRILDGVEGAWDAETPCEGWRVRDVVDHVITTQRDFFAQHELDAGPDPDRSDPAAAWRAHSVAAQRVLEQPGVADRAYDGWFGPTTVGETLTEFYGWDLQVHGSDIARATAQNWSVTDKEADALLRVAEGWGPALRSEGICGPAIDVTPDASPTDRLLAHLGRDPHWQPR